MKINKISMLFVMLAIIALLFNQKEILNLPIFRITLDIFFEGYKLSQIF